MISNRNKWQMYAYTKSTLINQPPRNYNPMPMFGLRYKFWKLVMRGQRDLNKTQIKHRFYDRQRDSDGSQH